MHLPVLSLKLFAVFFFYSNYKNIMQEKFFYVYPLAIIMYILIKSKEGNVNCSACAGLIFQSQNVFSTWDKNQEHSIYKLVPMCEQSNYTNTMVNVPTSLKV